MQIDNPKTLIKSYTMISNNGLKQIVHLLIRGVGAEMANYSFNCLLVPFIPTPERQNEQEKYFVQWYTFFLERCRHFSKP